MEQISISEIKGCRDIKRRRQRRRRRQRAKKINLFRPQRPFLQTLKSVLNED